VLLTLKNYIMNNKIAFGITYQYGYALFNLRIKIMSADADRIQLAHTPSNYYLGYNEHHGHYKFEGIMPSTAFHALYDDLLDAMDAYKIDTIKLKTRYRKAYRCSYKGRASALYGAVNSIPVSMRGLEDLPF
jgi:hypothetical protein